LDKPKKRGAAGRPPTERPRSIADPKAIGAQLLPGIAARIEQELAARGWSVPHLARLAGVTPQAITKVLRQEGLPSLPVLAAIADALRLPRGWLAFGGTGA